MQRHGTQHQTRQLAQQRYFTASEVAQFEYCPLVWWYEQYEEAAQTDTDDLFARLVELEHEHDTQAPALPEYQMIEQILVKRGAFDGEGGEGGQASEEDEEMNEVEEEREGLPDTRALHRRLLFSSMILAVLAVACILLSLVLR